MSRGAAAADYDASANTGPLYRRDEDRKACRSEARRRAASALFHDWQDPADIQPGQEVGARDRAHRGAVAQHDRQMAARAADGRAEAKLYVHTSVLITTNLTFAEWSSVFGDGSMGV